jgi:pimeloyl-ACP methyl ester carboxylesterase
VTLKAHAERMIEELDAHGINYACEVGHDVGGAIAQTMAVRWPHRVSRLCLVNSVAFDEWPTREVKLARATLPLTRHLPPTWLLSVLRTDLLRGYTDGDRGAHSIERYVKPFASGAGRDVFMEHLLALDPADTATLEPRLRDVLAPTAIVWGAHDPFLPMAIARRLESEIPGATLEMLPDGRHFTPEEAPDRVAAAIAALLSR